jgi:hypothetical protein
MKLLSLALVGLAALSLAGCAGGTRASAGVRHNLVTTAELARAGDANLYDALRSIRPSFLRSRQPATALLPEAPVAVYLGHMQMMDGVEHLRMIMARNVQEVQFLEPDQANLRFGGSNAGGALVVIMKP